MSADGRQAFLFVLRAFPDLDHICPLMWKLLQVGHGVDCLFINPEFAYDKDPRMGLLRRSKRFQVEVLHESRYQEGESRWQTLKRNFCQLLRNRWVVGRRFARRYGAVVFEWTNGPSSRDKTGWRFRLSYRDHLMWLARDLGIPVVSLPHGLNVKLNVDSNSSVIETMRENGGTLPFGDRNFFDRYVFNTDYHRECYVEHAEIQRERSAAWGSLRFCPEWLAVLDTIVERAKLPKSEKFRVVFFQPKWHNRVDKEATIRMLCRLAEEPELEVYVKGHPRRGSGGLDDDRLTRLFAEGRAVDASQMESFSLVPAADAVIELGTGMLVDTIIQNVPLIYPKYLHENTLVVDRWPACLTANDQDELLAVIHSLRSETVWRPDAELRNELIKQLVYAGREPFDVLTHHVEELEALAAEAGVVRG